MFNMKLAVCFPYLLITTIPFWISFSTLASTGKSDILTLVRNLELHRSYSPDFVVITCGREDSNLHGINSHQPLKLAWLPLQHCRIMSASYPFRSPLISVGQTEHLPSMPRVGFEPTVIS